jgi:hypothetical protein
VPTPQERLESTEQKVVQIVQNLAQAGMGVEEIVAMTGFSEAEVRSLLADA